MVLNDVPPSSLNRPFVVSQQPEQSGPPPLSVRRAIASFHVADVKESSLEQSEVNGSSGGVDCCFEGSCSDVKSEISITHLAALLAAIFLKRCEVILENSFFFRFSDLPCGRCICKSCKLVLYFWVHFGFCCDRH